MCQKTSAKSAAKSHVICAYSSALSSLSILHFAVSDLQSTFPAPLLSCVSMGNSILELVRVSRCQTNCGGLLLKLSGFAPVIPRLSIQNGAGAKVDTAVSTDSVNQKGK